MKTKNRIQLFSFQLFLLLFLSSVASAQLRADFSATPLTGCPPMVVSFQDQSTGNPTSWRWDLGNGTVSTVQNPIATYFNPGTYNIKLVIRTATGADSVVKSNYIVVNALPRPIFSVSDTAGCLPHTVRFFDSSLAGSGTITNWQWDFGDGSLSSAQHPTHTYTSAGTYTISLRVTNSNGCSQTITKPAAIKLVAGAVADFSFSSPQNCHTPTTIQFTNNSTGGVGMTYKWNFGDGNTSTVENPVHNYTTAGTYTVSLIAINPLGCSDTMVKVNAISIGFVKADFSRPDSVCAGTAFTITNTSTPSSAGAYWTFGDGNTSTSINPVVTYAAAGTYQIKLVNDFGACTDSIVKSIKVLARPRAQFTAQNTIGCKVPHTVSFTNNSSGAASYLWQFGDGTTSTAASPSHTYTQPGNFTVTLVVRNNSGCTDTLVRTELVKIQLPSVTGISGLPVAGCLPLTINPIAVTQSNQPIQSYFWDFGDGVTSTSATPNHTYTTEGVFNVKVVITTMSGCKDSLTLNGAVRAGNKPRANFSADPRDVCAHTGVNFTDLTTGGSMYEWFWQFGDGGTSQVQNPIHTYTDTGKFDVTLVVFNYGCSDTLIIPKYINIRPPIAKFDTAFLCSEPLTRQFKDSSVDAHSWLWDFGDGNSSTQQHPRHTYAAPGTYKVRLTVWNGNCTHFTERNIRIIDEKGILTASDSVACLRTRVTFNINNVNGANIQNYRWFFHGVNGSGVATATQPVAQIYTTAGTHNVAVVMLDELGCSDTIYTAVPVKIYGPKANFFPAQQGTCLGGEITFNDSTVTDGVHPITEWTWDYGEGPRRTYTAAPFQHTYSSPGTYNVKMVVKDSYGCTDSITKPSVVTVSKPVAGFAVSDTMVCPGVAFQFTNQSTGGVNPGYTWTFGDGNMSGEINPSHTYSQEGVYDIKMLMHDNFGCTDSAFASVKMFSPVANFQLSDSFSSCPPLLVDFTNESKYYISHRWDFGDGSNSQLMDPSRMYTYPGTYNVRLTVTNNGGCTNTFTKNIVIQGPTGVFSYNPLVVCAPGAIDFTANTQNTIKYIWDYNDGNTQFSNQPVASHTYDVPGKYLPKLILEDASGCRVPIVGADSITIIGVESHILSQSRVVCDSGMVIFSDSTITNDVVTSYQWDFGNGNTSTAANPTNFYTSTGWYNVTLVTTTQFGCKDTATNSNFIKVVTSPLVRITGDTAACEPATFTLGAEFVRNDSSTVSWNWTFSNGQQYNQQNAPAVVFANPGTYPVQLQVVNSDGCSFTTGTNAIVHPKPVVDAGVDTIICRFDSYTLQATGASRYTWNTDPTLSCTDCATPSATPADRTTYYVTGETIFGCTNTDSVTLRVKQPFTMSVGIGDTLCVGQTKQLLASGAELYQWYPSAFLNNATIANPVSRPDSTVTYQVIGRDDMNCFRDTGYVTLKVYPIPEISITNGDQVTLNVGSTVRLQTQSSPDITRWNWSPSLGLNCNTCPAPDATPRETIVYSVIGSNDGRCVARDQITINVVCNGANIYVPNTFSPNNDGMNDVFYPRGKGLYTIKTFRVFNRWGQLVFEKNNIVPNDAIVGWDGTFKGEKLQADVFVYVMEVLCDNNTILPMRGNVSLIR